MVLIALDRHRSHPGYISNLLPTSSSYQLSVCALYSLYYSVNTICCDLKIVNLFFDAQHFRASWEKLQELFIQSIKALTQTKFCLVILMGTCF